MATKTRVKIAVSDLISNIEKSIEKKKIDDAKAIDKFETDLAKWEERVETFLKNKFENTDSYLEALTLVKNSWGSRGDKWGIELPKNLTRPKEPITGNYKGAEKDLKILKLTTDETISVSTDSEWSKYL